MRIFFILIAILYPYYLHSKDINLQYEIDWNSIHLADIFWSISIDKNEYEIDFLIKSYGLTDKIYNYESLTSVNGYIQKNHLRPLKYSSKTKSSNQDVYSNIEFDNDGKIASFDISKQISEDQVQMQKKILDKYLYFTDPISQITQYFIYKINSDRNEIIVGPKEKLGKQTISLKDINLLAPNIELQKKIFVKVRSTGDLLEANVNLQDNQTGVVNLTFPEDGISPGQACVFYNKDQFGYKVLGGGWIKE